MSVHAAVKVEVRHTCAGLKSLHIVVTSQVMKFRLSPSVFSLNEKLNLTLHMNENSV